jgi:2-polyprenyl-3-methyl-5-hydroxy-6-metoxy-1,4-benzoquinol methylase
MTIPNSSELLSDEQINALINSDDFYKKARNTIGRKILFENQHHEKNIVEYECAPQILDKILAHIESVWTVYGATEPHWSVVSTSAFRADVIDQNIQAFHDSGRNEVENLKRLLNRTSIDPSTFQVALEYGCGVGRVTRWLANVFPVVYGVDISTNHLSLAKSYFQQEGVNNIKTILIQSLQNIDALPRYDFLYSKIVLQHNPPPVIYLILNKLCEKLNPGGSGVLQIPTYCLNYTFKASDYVESMEQINRMEMHVLPQPVIFDVLARHHCHCREVSRDHLVTTMDYVSTTFVFTKTA